MEIWYKIEDFDYEISNQGRLRNLKTNKLLSTSSVNSEGYVIVCLRKDGKSHSKRFHRLLAEYFVPKIDGKTHINHINGIKTDNRIENLEWVTQKENNTLAAQNGLYKNDLHRKYDKSLDEEIIKLRKERYSYKYIMEKLNVPLSKINNVVNKKNW